MSAPIGRWLTRGLALGLYLISAWVSIEFMRSANDVALIWLPAGIGFTLVILTGARALPLIATAIALMHLLLAPVSLLFGAYSVAANTLAAFAGWQMFRRLGGGVANHLTVRTGFLILGGALVLSVVSASIGTVGLVHAGMAPAEAAPQLFLAWALGDIYGVLALTATLLLVAAALRRRGAEPSGMLLPLARRSRLEYAIWAVLAGATLALLLKVGEASGTQALGLAGLPMALLLWTAIRFPPLFTFIATTVLALAVAALTGLGIAGFRVPNGAVESAVLVAFLCVTLVVPQVVAGAIHENRVAGLRLLRRALRDPLTGLPNRAAFDEDLRAALNGVRERSLLVAYLDLDQFRIINDTLSHAAGDALLKELAALLRSALPVEARLYRIGGDEFAILQADSDEAAAQTLLQELSRQVSAFRLAWEAGVVSTRVSIGYVLAQTDDVDAGVLLAQVDAACFTAKELGGNRIQHAAPGDQAVRERTEAMHWVMRINAALENEGFVLFCQGIEPLAEVPQGLHFEILLRKRDAQTGAILLPAQFIAAAERFGLSARLDTHVVERTLNWLEAHPQHAERVQLCSINLSAASLVDPGFASFLRERLAASSFPLQHLCFEITETGAVRDLALASSFIHDMRALGCRFALDDFGTGFCSFAYLPKLEVEFLKIDGSFVREAEQSPLALAIVQAIVQIAKVTGRKTVAEWVETPALAQRMRELGLDYAQGYAFSEPQPIDRYFAQARIDVPSAQLGA